MEQFTARQQEIIDAAIYLIEQGGIQNVTMKNIAKHLGISEPAIYRHFESKMDILFSMLERFKQRSKNHLIRAQSVKASGVMQLRTIFLEHVGQFRENPHMAAVVFSEEAFQDHSRLAETVFLIMNFAHETIIEIIREAQQQGQIRDDIPGEHLTLLILGALRLMVKRWRLSNYGFDLKTESERMWCSLQTLLQKN